jgi:hypothetical protein
LRFIDRKHENEEDNIFCFLSGVLASATFRKRRTSIVALVEWIHWPSFGSGARRWWFYFSTFFSGAHVLLQPKLSSFGRSTDARFIHVEGLKHILTWLRILKSKYSIFQFNLVKGQNIKNHQNIKIRFSIQNRAKYWLHRRRF